MIMLFVMKWLLMLDLDTIIVLEEAEMAKQDVSWFVAEKGVQKKGLKKVPRCTEGDYVYLLFSWGQRGGTSILFLYTNN